MLFSCGNTDDPDANEPVIPGESEETTTGSGSSGGGSQPGGDDGTSETTDDGPFNRGGAESVRLPRDEF